MVVIKVTNVDRSKKVGIVAKNLEEFHAKVMRKYKITDKSIMDGVRYHLSSDAVIIDNDEYFQTLEPQTSVIMILKEQRNDMKTDFELLMDDIRKWQKDYLTAGKEVKHFINKNNDKIFETICKALNIRRHIEQNNDMYKGGGDVLETEEKLYDDKTWFEGLDTTAKTKESYMHRKAQDRFRSYFYKTKDDLYHSSQYREDQISKAELDFLINNFRKWLTSYNFLGHIFDRSKSKDWEKESALFTDNGDNEITLREKSLQYYIKLNKIQTAKVIHQETDLGTVNNKKRIKLDVEKRKQCSNILENSLKLFPLCKISLCSASGLFKCEGAWDKKNCTYKDHIINPYTCREYRILFQTWNLDHQIEKSRSVIPSILENVKLLSEKRATCLIHADRPAVHLSQVLYFLELFTMANLRLVHIVCHDKKSHSGLKSLGGSLCSECHELEKQQMER